MVDSDLGKHLFTVISTYLYQDSQCTLFLHLCFVHVYEAFICIFIQFMSPVIALERQYDLKNNIKITAINDLRYMILFFSLSTAALHLKCFAVICGMKYTIILSINYIILD